VPLQYFLLQASTYSIVSWLLFTAITFGCSRYLRFGMFIGHICVALLVAGLDVYWIQSEINRPGWNGTPDQDIVFHFGVMLRVILINTVLLPVSVLGSWIRRKRAPGSPVDDPKPLNL
jgi:hypothetical protein